MKLPPEVRDRFRRYGRKGGQARARGMSPARRQGVARRAALRRWAQARFGSPSFKALALPGGSMIDAGLDDLAEGKVTVESLAVSLASSRLRREGVPMPAAVFFDADHRLYRMLEKKHGELAHFRFHALLRQVASFADACSSARTDRDAHAG